jgi:hypothetical protein
MNLNELWLSVPLYLLYEVKMSLTTRGSSQPNKPPRMSIRQLTGSLRACVAFAYTGTSPVEQPPREEGLIHLNPKFESASVGKQNGTSPPLAVE